MSGSQGKATGVLCFVVLIIVVLLILVLLLLFKDKDDSVTITLVEGASSIHTDEEGSVVFDVSSAKDISNLSVCDSYVKSLFEEGVSELFVDNSLVDTISNKVSAFEPEGSILSKHVGIKRSGVRDITDTEYEYLAVSEISYIGVDFQTISFDAVIRLSVSDDIVVAFDLFVFN